MTSQFHSFHETTFETFTQWKLWKLSCDEAWEVRWSIRKLSRVDVTQEMPVKCWTFSYRNKEHFFHRLKKIVFPSFFSLCVKDFLIENIFLLNSWTEIHFHPKHNNIYITWHFSLPPPLPPSPDVPALPFCSFFFDFPFFLLLLLSVNDTFRFFSMFSSSWNVRLLNCEFSTTSLKKISKAVVGWQSFFVFTKFFLRFSVKASESNDRWSARRLKL